MTEETVSKTLIDAYLARLDRALLSLPESERHRIVEDVSGHIDQGRESLTTNDEANVRALLDRVGDPEDIAAEAGVEPLSSISRRGDVFVPWLLLLGGFALGIGWIIGVILLWTSSTWKRWEKVLGTLVLPGGLISLFELTTRAAGTTVCTAHGGPGEATVRQCTTHGYMFPGAVGIVVFVVILVAPIAVAVYLDRCRRKRRRTVRFPVANHIGQW